VNQVDMELVNLVKFNAVFGAYGECANGFGMSKPILVVVLVWRLAVNSTPPGNSININGLLEHVCLVMRVVPLNDDCNVGVVRGATRLAVCVPHQAI